MDRNGNRTWTEIRLEKEIDSLKSLLNSKVSEIENIVYDAGEYNLESLEEYISSEACQRVKDIEFKAEDILENNKFLRVLDENVSADIKEKIRNSLVKDYEKEIIKDFLKTGARSISVANFIIENKRLKDKYEEEHSKRLDAETLATTLKHNLKELQKPKKKWWRKNK